MVSHNDRILLLPQAKFPVELFAEIIDSLEDWDKPSLYTCALVCRSWTHFAHRRLFNALWLYFESKPGPTFERLELLAHGQGLREASRSYVRSLFLSSLSQESLGTTIGCDLYWAALKNLPNLRNLDVSMINLSHKIDLPLVELTPTMSLDRWSYSQRHSIDVQNIGRQLMRFSHIGRASIRKTNRLGYFDCERRRRESKELVSISALEQLHIDTLILSVSSPWIDMLRKLLRVALRSLISLTLRDYGSEELAPILRLIEDVAPNLKCFTIDITDLMICRVDTDLSSES